MSEAVDRCRGGIDLDVVESRYAGVDPDVVAVVREARMRQEVIDESQEIIADVMAQRREARDTVDRVVSLLERWRKIGKGDGRHAGQLEDALLGR